MENSVEMKPLRTSLTIEGRQIVFYKYILKDCQRKWSRMKKYITIHIRRHTGERPYVCKIFKKVM